MEIRTLVVIGLLAALGVAAFFIIQDTTISPTTPQKDLSLYERLGGRDAITSVVSAFGQRLFDDAKLDSFFGRLNEQGEQRFIQLNVEFLCQAAGGPCQYTGRSMIDTHRGMGTSNNDFELVAQHLRVVLKQFSVPAREQREILALIETTRSDIVEPALTAENLSLYDRLGGLDAISAVVNSFTQRLFVDPAMDRFFATWDDAKKQRITQLIVEFLCVAVGGPCEYTGRSMSDSHRGFGITNDDWTLMSQHLKATFIQFSVPDREQGELFTLVESIKSDIIESSATTSTVHTITINSAGSENFFEPDRLVIQPGDTVKWVNESGAHTVTAFHPDNARPLRIPEGATNFDSGIMAEASLTFELTFTEPGVYDYLCLPHEFFGMVGTIVVGESLDGPGLTPPQGELPGAVRIALDELNDWAKGQ